MVIEAYQKEFGWAPTAGVLAHLKRELVHAIYRLICGMEQFCEAYKSGIDLDDKTAGRPSLEIFQNVS